MRGEVRRDWWLRAGVLLTAAGLYAQNTLMFFASVADDKGVPVATLAPDDLKVGGERRRGRKSCKVEPIDWPVKVQVLIDNGAGIDAALVQIRNGLKGFVEALPDGIEMSLLHDRPAAAEHRPADHGQAGDWCRAPIASRRIPGPRGSSRR